MYLKCICIADRNTACYNSSVDQLHSHSVLVQYPFILGFLIVSQDTAEFTEESWLFSGLFILQCVTHSCSSCLHLYTSLISTVVEAM